MIGRVLSRDGCRFHFLAHGCQRLILVLGVMAGIVLAQQAPPTASRSLRAMGLDEAETWRQARVRSWIGEKVVFLTDPSPFSDKNFYVRRFGQKAGAGYTMPNEYAGKVGTVTDTLNDATELVVIVEPSGEKLIADTPPNGNFGFARELEAARLLVGTTVWSRGTISLLKRNANPQQGGSSFDVEPVTKLTVAGADWGYRGLYLHVTSTSGVDGLYSSNQRFGFCIDSRFHVFQRGNSWDGLCEKSWALSDDFFLEDPRKVHSSWSPDIWKLIVKGEVAIGMTREMLEVACHPIYQLGFKIDGNDTSAIQQCGAGGRKFLFSAGKVTAYTQ